MFNSLSSEAAELEFWFKNIEAMNKRCICLSQLTKKSSAQILIYCDESDTGYGCHFTNKSVDKKALDCYGFWNGVERKQRSTLRELEAINKYYRSQLIVLKLGEYRLAILIALCNVQSLID